MSSAAYLGVGAKPLINVPNHCQVCKDNEEPKKQFVPKRNSAMDIFVGNDYGSPSYAKQDILDKQLAQAESTINVPSPT